METKKLEVGDELIRITQPLSRKHYYFATVVRVTPKFAFTEGGSKLKREPDRFGYYDGYRLATPALKEEAERAKTLDKANTWFFNHERIFTDEEKLLIQQYCLSLSSQENAPSYSWDKP